MSEKRKLFIHQSQARKGGRMESGSKQAGKGVPPVDQKSAKSVSKKNGSLDYLLLLIPAALIALGLFGGIRFLKAERLVGFIRGWAEVQPPIPLVNPIKFALPKPDDEGGLLLETAGEPQNVRAMMDGKVVEVGQGVLKIAPDAKDFTIVYIGLSSISVNPDDWVKNGQQVGTVQPDGSSERKVRLRVTLAKGK